MADWYISSAGWTAVPQFATGAYSVGQFVRPLTAPNFNAQFAFRCTTAGSATVEPAWPGNNNSTVTATGGAVFTNVSGQSTYGWSAPAGNIYCMTNQAPSTGRFSIGDRIFLSSDHAESSTLGVGTIPNAGGFGLIQIISVNRAGSVPPVAADQTSGASITYTGSGSFNASEAVCDLYWQGVTFNVGGTATNIWFNNNGTKHSYLRNCAIVFSTSFTTANITNNSPGQVTFDNTTVQFNNAGQRFLNGYAFDCRWINTPSALLGTVPTTLFNGGASQTAGSFVCRGVDLSALTTTLFYYANAAPWGKLLLDSCRIASGVTRLGTTGYNTSADEVELVNCYDGTNILSERHTPAGDLTTSRSTTLVGGAQDDVGLFSHQMVSSARADMLALTLDSFWLDVEQSAVGAAHTATVEIVSSGTLNNTDISLVLEYQGTSGSSLATLASTLPSALTASAAVPTSAATWNSPPATPVYQHLQASFTPQTAGRLRGLVRLGKPSTTVYVNPQLTVT